MKEAVAPAASAQPSGGVYDQRVVGYHNLATPQSQRLPKGGMVNPPAAITVARSAPGGPAMYSSAWEPQQSGRVDEDRRRMIAPPPAAAPAKPYGNTVVLPSNGDAAGWAPITAGTERSANLGYALNEPRPFYDDYSVHARGGGGGGKDSASYGIVNTQAGSAGAAVGGGSQDSFANGYAYQAPPSEGGQPGVSSSGALSVTGLPPSPETQGRDYGGYTLGLAAGSYDTAGAAGPAENPSRLFRLKGEAKDEAAWSDGDKPPVLGDLPKVGKLLRPQTKVTETNGRNLTTGEPAPISGYVDTSAHWNFGTGNANASNLAFGGEHSKQGNVGLADGCIQGLSISKLQDALKNSAAPSDNKLAFPAPEAALKEASRSARSPIVLPSAAEDGRAAGQASVSTDEDKRGKFSITGLNTFALNSDAEAGKARLMLAKTLQGEAQKADVELAGTDQALIKAKLAAGEDQVLMSGLREREAEAAPPKLTASAPVPQPEVQTIEQRLLDLLAQCQRRVLQARGGEPGEGRDAGAGDGAERGVHQCLRLSRPGAAAGRAHRLRVGARRLPVRPESRPAAVLDQDGSARPPAGPAAEPGAAAGQLRFDGAGRPRADHPRGVARAGGQASAAG